MDLRYTLLLRMVMINNNTDIEKAVDIDLSYDTLFLKMTDGSV